MAELSQGLNTLDAGTVTWREVSNDNLVLLNGLYLVAVGLASARPAAPGAGDIKGYYATDTNVLSIYTGGVWVHVNATTLPDPLTIANLKASGTGGIAVKDSANTTVATLCPTGEGILPNTIKAPTTGGILVKDSAGTTVATIGKAGTTAGNARGTNAIDWQSSRLAATQVASGLNSCISGGSQNTASGEGAAVGGGSNNDASGENSTIAGGAINAASALNSTVGGGDNNTASGTASTIAGGGTGTASGLHASVGGGLNSAASGDYATVPGGRANTAYNYAETIAGRFCTISSGSQTTIDAADRLFAIGNGTGTGARNAAFEVFGTGDAVVAGALSAELLERTPILPPWDDAANPVLTAADSGGTFAFTGTCDFPDASTLPEGWCVTLIFIGGADASSVLGGIFSSPDGNFASGAIYENGSGRAVLHLICDGTDYIAASQTGTIVDV